MEQLQEAREEKKRLRKNLKEFEEQFFRQNGRWGERELVETPQESRSEEQTLWWELSHKQEFILFLMFVVLFP